MYNNRWASDDFGSSTSSAQELGEAVLASRVGVSSTHDIPNVGLTGPNGTIVTQVRFSDEAIDLLMQEGTSKSFSKALMSMMALMDLDRSDDIDDRFDERADYLDDKSKRIAKVEEAYEALVQRYQQFTGVGELTWRDGSAVSEEANLLLVPQDGGSPEISSIAQLKGQLIGSLFGDLIEAAKRLGEPDTLLIGYALLQMTPPSLIEIMINAQFETDHDGGFHRYDLDLYGKGQGSFINAGMFDLDSLIGAKEL